MSIWDKGASPSSPVRGEATETIGHHHNKSSAILPPLPKQLQLPYSEYDFDAIDAFPIEAISSGSSISDGGVCIAETSAAQGDRITAPPTAPAAPTTHIHEPKTTKLSAISRGYLKRFGSLFGGGAHKTAATAPPTAANRGGIDCAFTPATEIRGAKFANGGSDSIVVAAAASTSSPLTASAGVNCGTSRSTSISSANSSKELCCVVQGGKSLVISEKSGQEIQERRVLHASDDDDCVHCVVGVQVQDGVDQVELRKSTQADKSGFLLPRVILKARYFKLVLSKC